MCFPEQVQNQLVQPKLMSKMHSWPPMQQGIERPMSDLEPVFSVPMLPRILCPVPEQEPLALGAPLAKGGAMIGAADLEIGRQADELRRVLRSMYKTHFQMQTEVRCEISCCQLLPEQQGRTHLHNAILG